MSNSILDRIKELRLLCGMSQGDLAFEIDETAGNVSHIENGRRALKVDVLKKINEAFSKQLGDQWLYLTTGNKSIPLDNGVDHIEKLLVLECLTDFLQEAEAYKTIRVKGTISDLVGNFAEKLNEKVIISSGKKVSNGG